MVMRSGKMGSHLAADERREACNKEWEGDEL